MRLIEDLGLRDYGTQGLKKRYGLYECPVCHEHFECAVGNFKSGRTTKCRICLYKVRGNTKSFNAAKLFIAKATIIHGEAYNYMESSYINNKTKVEIACLTCNSVFWQTPNDHLSGKGCPTCAKERSNIALRMSEKSDRPTLLYYIYFPEVNLWKIGCTARTLEERFIQEKLEYTVIHTKEYASGNEAYRVEKFILDATKEFQHKGKVLDKGGNSELRTQPIENFYSLLVIAEHS